MVLKEIHDVKQEHCVHVHAILVQKEWILLWTAVYCMLGIAKAICEGTHGEIELPVSENELEGEHKRVYSRSAING